MTNYNSNIRNDDYLAIQLTPKDVDLIFDLANIETILQIRDGINNITDKTVLLNKIVQTFDSFMDFKDKLSNLREDIVTAENNIAATQENKVAVVILSRKMLKIFDLLCKETTKETLPDDIKKDFEAIGRELIQKIDKSFEDGPLPVERKSQLKQNSDENTGSLPINILNSKASA
jgi:lipid II:glycine glycyltransferase (peptidoglycan interpeptide bridge formation enzyme)